MYSRPHPRCGSTTRANKLDAEQYGVAPHLPYKGGWFIRNYVLQELAALNKRELLLWDWWGAMSDTLESDTLDDYLEAVDHMAEVILSNDSRATRGLFENMDGPGDTAEVTCFSPTGDTKVEKLAA